MRLSTRVGFAVGLALVLVGGISAGVGAHASLEGSIPASGAVLDEAPDELVLDFNEPVEVDLGGITLAGADGASIEIGKAHLRGSDGAGDVVAATLPNLGPGQYVAGFQVVSADGHPGSGNIVVRIGAGAVDIAASPVATPSAVVDRLYGIARFALYPTLVGSLGIWLFALLLLSPSGSPSSSALAVLSPTRVRRLVIMSLGLCAAAAGAQFVLAVAYLTGGTLGDAFGVSRWGDVAQTSVGQWLLVRLAVSVVLCAAVMLMGRRATPRHRFGTAAVGVLFAVLAATAVGDGHGNAGRWLIVGFGSAWVHVVAMALWLAGLAALLWGVGTRDLGLLEAVTGRWSKVAAVCVALIVFTGVIQAWRLLPDLDAVDSRYGWLLIAKSVLVVAMVGLGNRGRLLLHRRVATQQAAWPNALRLSVLVELVVAVAVLVLTTVIVQTDPADGSSAAPGGSLETPATARPWTVTITEGPRTMTVTLDSMAPGRHRMTITVDDSALPFGDPAELEARLTLSAEGLGPIPVLFTEAGRLRWTSDAVEIPAVGTWQFEAFIDDPTVKVRFSTAIDIATTGGNP